jgi:hypothetical protein
VAKPLIGEVDERDKPAPHHHVRDGAPLIEAEVCARGIVAAAVEKHEIARVRALQRLHHLIEEDAPALGVIIRVADHLDPRAFDQRAVIGPSRLADEDARILVRFLNEVCAEP